MMLETLVAWVLTYLLHSTLFLGAAFAARRLLGERRLALQEALFRAALLGGVVTSTLQLGFALNPVGGVLLLPDSSAPRVEATGRRTLPRDFAARLRVEPEVQGAILNALSPALTAESTGFPRRSAFRLPSARDAWRPAVLGAWASLALLGLVRLIVAWVRMRRLLAGRSALLRGEVAREVACVARALGIERRVRLSTAPRLAVPVAVGVIRPEVCLPVRVLDDLPVEERLALCAHELAHVARRDPGWIVLAGVVEALLPLQVLNRLARRRLTDLAECLADDLALAASVKPVGLARSLVGVASWSIGERAPIPANAAGAWSARSRLAFRVERLMDPVRDLERPKAFLLPVVAAVVLASALVAPAVTRADKDREAEPSEPAAAATTPDAPKPAVRPHPGPRPAVAPRPRSKAESAPAAPKAEALGETREAIERLARRIAERAGRHGEVAERMQEEIQALVTEIQPSTGEIERLSAELAQAATELASEMSKAFGEGGVPGGGRGGRTEATEHMRELQEKIRDAASKVRVPEGKLRVLEGKAREIAERARPTEAELAELRELSARLAQDVAPTAEEIAATAREAAQRAQNDLRRAEERVREAQERARLAEERARKAQEKARLAGEEQKRSK